MGDGDQGTCVYYRIVRSRPPTLADFTSRAEQGYPLPNPTPDRQRLWQGISAYATLAQARRNARRFPQLGNYIAAIDLSKGKHLMHERTTQQPGHFTIWGEPAQILACLVSVERAD